MNKYTISFNLRNTGVDKDGKPFKPNKKQIAEYLADNWEDATEKLLKDFPNAYNYFPIRMEYN